MTAIVSSTDGNYGEPAKDESAVHEDSSPLQSFGDGTGGYTSEQSPKVSELSQMHNWNRLKEDNQMMKSSVQEKIEWAESVFRRRPKERKPCPGHELVEDRHKWIERQAFRSGIKIERDLAICHGEVEKNRLKWLAEEEQAGARRWSMSSVPSSASSTSTEHRQMLMMMHSSALLDDSRRHSTGQQQHILQMLHQRRHSQQDRTADERNEVDQSSSVLQLHGKMTNTTNPRSDFKSDVDGSENNDEERESAVAMDEDSRLAVISWEDEMKQRADFSRELVREIAVSLSSTVATTANVVGESSTVPSVLPVDTIAVSGGTSTKLSLVSVARKNARLIDIADLPEDQEAGDEILSAEGGPAAHEHQPISAKSSNKAPTTPWSEQEGTEISVISSSSSQKSNAGTATSSTVKRRQQQQASQQSVEGGEDKDLVDPVFQVSSCGQTDVQCLDYCIIL